MKKSFDRHISRVNRTEEGINELKKYPKINQIEIQREKQTH